MAKNQSKSLQISAAGIYIVCAVVLIAVIAVGYLAIYDTASEKLKSSQRTLISNQQELAKWKAQEVEYTATKKNYERLQSRLAILQAKLPSTTNELNHFLDSINQRARTSRISKWTLFKQEGVISKGEYSVIPIRMEFSSTYEAAIMFFWELATMGNGIANNREQLINIRDITMTREKARTDDLGTTVKVLCVAETYLYTGDKNQAPAKKN